MRELFALVLLISFCSSLVGSAAEQPALKPPKELSSLASAPWVVELFAYGDLTGKKTNDAAVVFAVNPEGSCADKRKLVVALRDSDGHLKIVGEGLKAVPTSAGPSGGQPELSIKRNSVFLSQFGGSREKGTDTYQYKQVGNDWRLIGYTSEWYDSLSEALPVTRTDVNFLTGYVEASLTQNDKAKQKMTLYEIASVLGVPPKAGSWRAPAVVLKTSQAINKNGSSWKGPQDLSATIRSCHDGDKKLYLQVQVTDDQVQDSDAVALLDEKGRPLRPLTQARTTHAGGYTETLVFDLTRAPFTEHIMPGESAKNARQLPYTVRITDADQPPHMDTVISTAVSASGITKHGSLLLMPTTAPYSLANVDIQEGSVQYPIIDTPSE